MANEDMEGAFLGGGGIDHVVAGGEIFLNANQLSTLLTVTGTKMGLAALAYDDVPSGVTAHFVLEIATKLDELQSELLKREAEAMIGAFEDMPQLDLDDYDFGGLFGAQHPNDDT